MLLARIEDRQAVVHQAVTLNALLLPLVVAQRLPPEHRHASRTAAAMAIDHLTQDHQHCAYLSRLAPIVSSRAMVYDDSKQQHMPSEERTRAAAAVSPCRCCSEIFNRA